MAVPLLDGWTRDDSWSRGKGGWIYLVVDRVIEFPSDEKWPRYSADIPPELATLLDKAQRKSLGVNYSPGNATRANLVRSALRMYLNTVEPEADPDDTIDGTARDVIDLIALSPIRDSTTDA